MEKSERKLLLLTIFFYLIFFGFFFIPKNQNIKDLVFLILAFPTCVIVAILTPYYIRKRQIDEFKKKFPIEGIYEKYNAHDGLEQLNGEILKAKITYIKDYTFGIEEDFSFTGKITKARGTFGIENSNTGTGRGIYKHDREENKQQDCGIYEIQVDFKNEIFNNRIWIIFKNFHPYGDRITGTYYLQKTGSSSK